LRTEARDALASGDAPHAAAKLREALALWRGPVLAEFPLDSIRLDELRLAALEERVDADLAIGRDGELVRELESLVAHYPFRERFRAQLMLALYRAGRQAEALDVYRDTRRALTDELGLEPGRELQLLEQAILRQDAALDTAPRGGHVAPPSQAPSEPVERTVEERKVVAVLFVDLVDFMRHADEADPEDVRHLLRPYHAAAKAEIESHGGTLEKFAGDAAMGIFGAPVAHEDDAERAVRAGLRILARVRELNDADPSRELAARVGIATGDALVDLAARPEAGESMVAGDVVNTAARLEAAAAPGTVVVGERTYRATRDTVEYEELGPTEVRGKAEPVLIWRVRDVQPMLRRRETAGTPFVGRAEDLALLKHTYMRTLRESATQLVTVVGEPGIGKTRLLSEFSRSLRTNGETPTWRQGRCPPYGEGITFWALGEIVKAHAGILESDGADVATEKLAAAVSEVVDEPAERDWFVRQLAPLVGGRTADDVGADERAETAFTAWRRFLESVAVARPLVLVFEDLHWADARLLAFLEDLVDHAPDVAMLVVCTARPELCERRREWGGGQRNSTTIALSPLTSEETAQLLHALLANAVLPAETQTMLLERAGGNPLYAEQFVRLLVDHGILGVDGAVDSETAIRVPETIQAVISARLDTLSVEQKAVLQDAAVVGKVFWAGALAFMGGADRASIEAHLHELARKELVRTARVSSVKDDSEYAFPHILVRDVAYGQIPRRPRGRKHRAAAVWIERLAGERVVDHAELLAHHYVEAFALAKATGEVDEVGELEAGARRFLVMAGDRALQLDVERAAAYYANALELIAGDAPERPRVLAKLAETAWLAGRLPDAERIYEEAIPAFRRAGDVRAAGEAMIGLVQALRDRGRTQQARELLAQATALLEREVPGRELALAYLHAARDAFVSGRMREAIPAAEKAIELARRLGLDHHVARALQFRGTPRLDLGDLEGMADMEESLRMCLALGLGYYSVNAYGNLADALMRTAGPSRALELYREGVAFGARRGNVFKARWLEAETVWPLYELGRWDELLELAERIREWDEAQGPSQVGLIASSYATYVLAQRGRIREAEPLHDELLLRARESGDEQVLAPSLTVAAIISHRAGNPQAATAYVREFGELGTSGYWPTTLADAVRVATAAEELDLAESLLRESAALTPRGQRMLLTGQAVLAEAQDDFERSLELFERACAEWAACDHVVEHAHAIAGVGRSLLASGHAQDGAARLGEAREIYDRLGAQPLVADLAAALEQVA
jgi:class 3 adenylate cyclase